MNGKVFVFSATGNSQYLAEKICGDELRLIRCGKKVFEENREYDFEGQVLGFVFPVYAWGCPSVFESFIRNMKFKGTPSYVFAVTDCGDTIGKTLTKFADILAGRGLKLDYGDYFVMPNNYLPLGDVDDENTEKGKLKKADDKLIEVRENIESRFYGINQPAGVFNPILSGVVHNVFNKTSAKGYKKLWVNENCTGCGICSKVCPLENIKIENKAPLWGGSCVSCMACIHWCPEKAINYGKTTLQRGRYHNPKVTLKSLRGKSGEK